MKIKRLTASYGKLNHETLKFRDGLNIIDAPNESGKTTWCSFIRSMLYGVSSSERLKDGYLPDKLKYAPWSGAPMEGEMDLEADGGDITLCRRTVNRTAPMREFSACYTGTAIKVPGLSSSDAGEMLTGVSRDVFCRTAFVAQGDTAVTASSDLERHIQSILTTGEDDISAAEADARLRSWQRKRKYNSRGAIPELEEAIAAVRSDIESISETAGELSEKEERLNACRAEISSAEKQLADAGRTKKEKLLETMRLSEKEGIAVSEEYDDAFNCLNSIRSKMRESVLGGLDCNMPGEEASKDIERIKNLRNIRVRWTTVIIAILCLLLSVCGAALYRMLIPSIVVLAGAAACGITSVVLFVICCIQRRAVRSATEEIRQILRRYTAEDISDIDRCIREYFTLSEEESAAAERLKTAAENYDSFRSSAMEMQRRLIEEPDAAAGTSEAYLMEQLNGLRSEELKLVSELSAGGAVLHSMGDPMVLKTELMEMNADKKRLEHEYEAISLASDILTQAGDEIRSRFSPALGRKAAEYMSFLTDGKYGEMLIGRDFSAAMRPADGIAAMDSLYFSAGTLDCMYLSLRLAICELAMPEGETCPLIIDDALVNLDEERFARAIKLLEKISENRQVILFT